MSKRTIYTTILLLVVVMGTSAAIFVDGGTYSPLILRRISINDSFNIKAIDISNDKMVIASDSGSDAYLGLKSAVDPDSFDPQKWDWQINIASTKITQVKFMKSSTLAKDAIVVTSSGAMSWGDLFLLWTTYSTEIKASSRYRLTSTGPDETTRSCFPQLQTAVYGNQGFVMFTGCGAIKTAPASAGVPFDPRRFLKFIEFDTSTETMILKKFKEAELITHNDYMPIISASSDIRFQVMDADLIVGAVMHIDPYSSAVQTISFTRYSLPTFIASTLDDIESSRTLSWQYKVTEHQITEDVKEQYQISPILASSSLFGALIFPYKGSPAASDVLIDKVMYLGAECKSGSSNFRLLQYDVPFDSYKVFTGTHNAAKKKFYALTRVDQFLVDGIVYPSLDMMLTINYNPDDTNCDLNTFLEEPIASFTRIDYLNGDLASFVQNYNAQTLLGNDAMVFTGWSTGMNNRPEAFAGFVHRLTFADFDSVSHLKISKSALKMATVSVSDMFLKATDQMSSPAGDSTITQILATSPVLDNKLNVMKYGYATLKSNLFFTYQQEVIMKLNLKTGGTQDSFLADKLVTYSSTFPVTEGAVCPHYSQYIATKCLTQIAFSSATYLFTPKVEMASKVVTFVLTNTVDYFFSPPVKLSIIPHSCSIASKNMDSTQPKFYQNVFIIKRIRPDGLLESTLRPGDYEPVVVNLLGNTAWSFSSDLITCPLTFAVNAVKDKAGTPMSAAQYVSQVQIKPDGTLTISNYNSLDETIWDTAKVYISVTSDYYDTQTPLAALIQSHPCKSQTLTLGADGPIKQTIYYKLTISGFDQKPALDFSYAPPIVIDLMNVLNSSDPVNCPVTEFQLNKFQDPSGTFKSTQPDWLALDKTGKITVSNYVNVTMGSPWKLYLGATTSFQYYLDKDFKHLVEVTFDFHTCCNKTFTYVDSLKTQQLVYNVWETDKNITVYQTGGVVAKYSFSLKDDNPIKSEEELQCPIKASRIAEVVSGQGKVLNEAQFSKFLAIDNVSNSFIISNYYGIDVALLNGLVASIDRMTEAQQSKKVQFIKLQATQFVCTKSATLTVAAIKEISVSYSTLVLLTGKQQHSDTGRAQSLDMSSGFFESQTSSSCTLTSYKLTQALKPDGIALQLDQWKEIFVFDSTAKKLQVKGFAGVSLEDFKEVRLMFQSNISPSDSNDSNMTHAYHLVTVKISQTITYEQSKGKQPPKFVSNPEPIYINEHFTTGSNFKPITYTLPHITDPQGNGILPVVITNINDFTFVTFDPVFNRITINPNKISKQNINKMTLLKLKLENNEGISSTVVVHLVVNDLDKKGLEGGGEGVCG